MEKPLRKNQRKKNQAIERFIRNLITLDNHDIWFNNNIVNIFGKEHPIEIDTTQHTFTECASIILSYLKQEKTTKTI